MNNSEIIKEIKKDKHKYNLLSLICRYRYIPKNIELLFVDKLFDKKWKLDKAIRFLRANNIIKCVAVDCDKRNHKKDSITITSKGLKIARKLCVEITTYWSALRQSPSLARSRAVAVLSFVNGNNCINSLALNIMLENEIKQVGIFYNEDKEENLAWFELHADNHPDLTSIKDVHVVFSDAIPIPKDKDQLFLWVKYVDNLFELIIENLGEQT